MNSCIDLTTTDGEEKALISAIACAANAILHATDISTMMSEAQKIKDMCCGKTDDAESTDNAETIEIDDDGPLTRKRRRTDDGMERKYDELETEGVITIPVLSGAEIEAMRNRLIKAIANYTEFKSSVKPAVCGGFGAHGNMDSFHNPVVRELRRAAHRAVLPLFRFYGNVNLEQIVDRVCVRPKGQSPTAESVHRDEAPKAEPNDLIFGGWVNLNNTSQYFSCAKGTHREVSQNSGFAKIKDPDDIAKYKALCDLVEVPPGHMIIFYERIVHQVLSNRAKTDMYRLFTGWRLTTHSEPLIPDIERLLREQRVIPLKSGQLPPMYPNLYWVNWRRKLEDFSKQVRDEHCIDRTCQKTREVYRVVQQVMTGRAAQPPYSTDELQMHIPTPMV